MLQHYLVWSTIFGSSTMVMLIPTIN